jgi:hypothetical protein
MRGLIALAAHHSERADSLEATMKSYGRTSTDLLQEVKHCRHQVALIHAKLNKLAEEDHEQD